MHGNTPPETSTPTDTMGYSDEFQKLPHHRSAGTPAAHLLPYLKPGHRLLDIGCEPGTIAVGLASAVPPRRHPHRESLPWPADPVGQVLYVPRPRFRYAAGQPASRRRGSGPEERDPNDPGARPDARDASSDIDRSALIHRITAADPERRMPFRGAPLEAREAALISRWSGQGAHYETRWSFILPVRPEMPRSRMTLGRRTRSICSSWTAWSVRDCGRPA